MVACVAFALYLGSGITIVQPDEVAVVYRFGQLECWDGSSRSPTWYVTCTTETT